MVVVMRGLQVRMWYRPPCRLDNPRCVASLRYKEERRARVGYETGGATLGELIVVNSLIGGIFGRDAVGVVGRRAVDDGDCKITRSIPAELIGFDGDCMGEMSLSA